MQDIQTQILERLATYKFLSISQMETLGCPLSKKSLYEILWTLREEPRALIWKTTFRYNPKFGRVEDMHFLTQKGKKYLVREQARLAKDIQLPLWNTLFYKDYRHRKKTIDIHIAMRTSFETKGAEILFFDTYFSWKKKLNWSWRETATRIDIGDKSIRADAIFLSRFFPNGNLLFCLEVHQGYRVQKICDQLILYTHALAQGSVSTKYKVPVGFRVLSVFEHQSTLNTVIERLRDHPRFRFLQAYILAKSYDACMHDPLFWWQTLKWTMTEL